jgi:signal transduction histidine kinase
MAGTPSLALVRWAGLLAWVMVGVSTVLRSFPEISRLAAEAPGGRPTVAAAFMWSTLVVPWLVFGASFWWNTGRVTRVRPTKAGIASLLVGVACGVLLNTDLFLLVAIEAPLVLSGAAAYAWMGTQSLLTVAAGLSVAGTPDFDSLWCGATDLPRAWVEGLTIAAIVVWQWLAFAVGTMAARESRARAELVQLNGSLRATQGLLADSARLAERLDISRELHDAVGHHLTALSVNLDLASRRLQGVEAEAVREAHAVTRLLLGEVRQIVGQLRDTRRVDLPSALRTLGDAIEQPRVEVRVDEDLVVDPLRAHALYRCAQEALTNAVRHARATKVLLVLSRAPEGLCLEVRDDGKGATQVTTGAGLRGMRERVEEAGGTLEIETRPKGGFVLRVTLPEPEPGRAT